MKKELGVLGKMISRARALVSVEYDIKMRVLQNEELLKRSDVLEQELSSLRKESDTVMREMERLRGTANIVPDSVVRKIEKLIAEAKVGFGVIARKIEEFNELTNKVSRNNAKIVARARRM